MEKKDGFEYGVRHCLITRPVSILDYLVLDLGMTLDQAQMLMNLGSLYLNQQRTSKDLIMKENDYLRVHTKPRRFQSSEPLEVIYSCKDFLIINKPRGLPVHASVDNTQENILVQLQDKLKQEIFITHRLDVPTGGLLVVATSLESQKKINQLFAEGAIQKKYQARVHQPENLQPGLYRHFMLKSPKAPKIVSETFSENSLECLLKIESVLLNGNIDITLLTGRTHQIRSQLAYLKSPIIGDTTYLDPHRPGHPTKIELFCTRISFSWDGHAIDCQYEPQKYSFENRP